MSSFKVKKMGEQCCAIVYLCIMFEKEGLKSPSRAENLSGYAPEPKTGNAVGSECRVACFSYHQEHTLVWLRRKVT